MPIKYKPGKFDVDEHTSVRRIRGLLKQARIMGEIYLIARLVQVTKERGEKADLYPSEKRRLIEAINQARTGKQLPLKEWLPRGYQIVRLICTAKATIPDFKFEVTASDRKLIKKALDQFRSEKDIWIEEQIPSLLYSAKQIGVILE